MLTRVLLVAALLLSGAAAAADADELLTEPQSPSSLPELQRLTPSRAHVSTSQQILLHLKLIELPLKGETTLAEQVTTLFNSQEPLDPTFCRLKRPRHEIDHHLDQARRSGVVRVLAEPTLVTVSGRPVRFRSGGERPVTTGGVAKVREIGTELDCVATIQGDGTLHVMMQMKVSDSHETTQVNTAVLAEPGQPLIFAGLVSRTGKGSDDPRKQALILLVCDLVR